MRHTKPFAANQLASVTAFALVGVLVVSCAPSVSTSLRRPASASTSGTRPPSAPGSFPIPAPSYLGVEFAPHACIGFPAMARANGDTVFIDPGHGGADRGAQEVSYPGPGVDEATANLAVALDLLPHLRQAGYRVVLSRTTDTSVAHESTVMRSSDGIKLDNDARAACANAVHANDHVWIDMNGFGDRSARGAETIYDAVRPFATASERLAQLLQTDILASVLSAGWSITDRGVLTDENQGNATPGAPAGWHRLFLLGPAFPGWNDHSSQMPGAVLEPLFVTNPLEDRIVASRAGDQAIAQGIAKAVESFATGVALR